MRQKGHSSARQLKIDQTLSIRSNPIPEYLICLKFQRDTGKVLSSVDTLEDELSRQVTRPNDSVRVSTGISCR